LLLLRPDLDAETSYRLADGALYAAKKAGRNCLMWA
jgi:GGDEF domain-containing protein